MEHRLDFIIQLEKEADKHHASISNGLEHLTIKYLSSVTFLDRQDIRKEFLQQLRRNHRRDILKKNTGVGPHRDDLEFFINNVNADFGSQGQHRSSILSLKLAEIELIKSVTGDYPILLLDDVMSELDNYRQTKLLEGITLIGFCMPTSFEGELDALVQEYATALGQSQHDDASDVLSEVRVRQMQTRCLAADRTGSQSQLRVLRASNGGSSTPKITRGDILLVKLESLT